MVPKTQKNQAEHFLDTGTAALNFHFSCRKCQLLRFLRFLNPSHGPKPKNYGKQNNIPLDHLPMMSETQKNMAEMLSMHLCL